MFLITKSFKLNIKIIKTHIISFIVYILIIIFLYRYTIYVLKIVKMSIKVYIFLIFSRIYIKYLEYRF